MKADVEVFQSGKQKIKLLTKAQAAPRRYPKVQRAILVIIPAYNEEESIGQVVADIRRSAPFADILVVNDGSTDDTAAVARRSGAGVLNLPCNLGIGGAVAAAYTLAEEMGYQFVVRLDGDGQHDPKDIAGLLIPILQGQADMAVGSRFCAETGSFQPTLARRLGILVFGFVVSSVVGHRVRDVTSGLSCVNRKAMRTFARHYPQDYPEVESHVVLYKAGLRGVEVPVTMYARRGGRSSIGFMRSVYYAVKVLLATLFRAAQEIPSVPKDEADAVESADFRYSY